MTFLQTVAKDLYERLDGHFEQLTIIFPNKRARLFFNQALAAHLTHPIWSPHFTTISDLFQQYSPLTLADPILLICRLYTIYSRITGRDDTLDRFYSWGEMMLNDFDDVDNNLVSADKLFRNIEDLNQLTSFDYLSEQQEKAIRQFFQNFHSGSKTGLKEKFLSIWNVLLPIYQEFRQTLRADGYAYEGMLKRDVVEHADTRLCSVNSSQIYAFVGFNVLNETEKHLLTQLKERAQTLFYWDFDESYLQQENLTEAGRFIRQDIHQFGNALPLDADCYRQLHRSKQITYISAPTENAQAHYAAHWMEEVTKTDTPLNQNAVVLCDESLLLSVLHALPSSHTLNVTMGFPLQQTPVSSLINALLHLQLHGFYDDTTCRHAHASAVLRHPLTDRLSSGLSGQLIREMKQKHTLFPTTNFLGRNTTLRLIFTRQTNNNELLSYLSDIVRLLGQTYRQATASPPPETSSDTEMPLHIESVFCAFTLLSRLRTIHDSGLLQVNAATLARLIHQLIQAKTIPFHGEPAVGLQIMGLLETRNLDFRNVILLSANEGNLPRSDHQSSFIPYNLRDAYGMTTVEKRNSLYAYYFYRLLQRADNITLAYNNNADTPAKGEMSRFMRQLLIDTTIPAARAIRMLTLTSSQASQTPPVLSASKSPAVMQRLHQLYDWTDGLTHSRLSPSALNTYLDCPLQFYFHYVTRLTAEDDITEEVGNDIFGSIFHYCMEQIYSRILPTGHEIQSQTLYALSQNADTIGALVDEGFNVEYFKIDGPQKNRSPHYNGQQQLNRSVLMLYVQNQLLHDSQLCPLTVHAVEDKSHSLNLDISTPDGPVNVRLGGIIDRIDTVTVGTQRLHRIVDYKTSTVAQTSDTIDKLFAPTVPKRPYHILQAFYYAYIYSHTHTTPVAPALMYVKLTRSQAPQPAIRLGQTTVTDFHDPAVHDTFHEQLVRLITSIFTPSLPFTQTTNTSHCTYCDFAHICGRTSLPPRHE